MVGVLVFLLQAIPFSDLPTCNAHLNACIHSRHGALKEYNVCVEEVNEKSVALYLFGEVEWFDYFYQVRNPRPGDGVRIFEVERCEVAWRSCRDFLDLIPARVEACKAFRGYLREWYERLGEGSFMDEVMERLKRISFIVPSL